MKSIVNLLLVFVVVLFSLNLSLAEQNHNYFQINLDTIPGLISVEFEEPVFAVVEKIPRFPGCEEETPKKKKKKVDCSKQLMLEYIYKNLHYPVEAKNAGLEGMVVVQFVVTKEGKIVNINIKRSVSPSLDEEAIKVVHSMNYMEEKWIPGTQSGKPVNVLYTLPIRFKN